MEVTPPTPVSVPDFIVSLTNGLLEAADAAPAEQQRIAYAAVDKYVRGREEVDVLRSTAPLLKTIADMQPPQLRFVKIAHDHIMPRIAEKSERYQMARQLPCVDEARDSVIEWPDPSETAQWNLEEVLVQVAIKNSLAAERFALAHAIRLELGPLTVLAKFPLAFPSHRIKCLQDQIKELKEIGEDDPLLFSYLTKNDPLSENDEKHVSDVCDIYARLGFDVHTLERKQDNSPTEQLSPWIKRRLAVELSRPDIALCTDFFANDAAASAFAQSRPGLEAEWQNILKSPLLGAMIAEVNEQIQNAQNTLGTSSPGTSTLINSESSDRHAA